MGAAAVLTAGALAVGCSDDSSDNVILGGSLPIDNFPASTVETNNVADDGRAFSPSGQTVDLNTDDFRIYRNVSNGQAIALYTTGNNTGGAQQHLYASWFDGSVWHAPVELRGSQNDQADEDAAIQGFKACWINTAGNADADAAARNGDAVIVWKQNDEAVLQPTGTVNNQDEQTAALWATYFDVSAANSAASGTVVGGFDTSARRIDEEDVIGVAPGGQPDPSVDSFGFVSDSLAHSHFFGSGTDGVDSGNTTTLLHIVYDEETASTTAENRFFFVAVDGGQPSNDLATLFATRAVVGGVTLGTADSAQDGFGVHDNLMIWLADVTEAGVAPQPQEQTAIATLFDDTGVDSSVVVGSAAIDNDLSDQVDLASESSFVGPDDGLGSWYFVITEDGFRPDNSQGGANERDVDTDLFVVQIDNDGTLTVEREEIDNFRGGVTGGALSTKETGGVGNVGNADARIARSGEYMMVIWTQNSTDLNDLDASAAVNTPNDNLLLHAAAVQLNVLDANGNSPDRDLADSVSTVVISDSEVSSGGNAAPASTDTDDDVDGVRFQEELGSGWAIGNQPSNQNRLAPRECAIQSNNLRMNWIYKQQVSLAVAASADEERLLQSGAEVTLGTTATDPPTIAKTTSSVTEAEVAIRDVDYNAGFNALAFDAGDVQRDAAGAPAGESGRPLIVFIMNRDNPASDFAVAPAVGTAGLFREPGLFVSDNGGTPELISTNGAGDLFTVTALVGGVTVAANENTGNGGHHAGTRLDLVWIESGASVQNSANLNNEEALASRSYDKTVVNTTGVSLAQRFTPEAGTGTNSEPPVYIDHPSDAGIGNDDGFETIGASAFTFANLAGGDNEVAMGQNGNTVEVLFVEGERLWGQSNSGLAAWTTSNGVADPQLVDNDVQSLGAFEVDDVLVFFNSDCDNLPGTQIFFTRDQFNNNSTLDRAFVRVHN